jgi:citronellol/citronellal dehydrogenase
MSELEDLRVDPRTLEKRSLQGKRALVTGAGSGIGRAIALRLTELGATVTGVGRRAERLAETGELIRTRHSEGGYVWCTLDVRNRAAAAELVTQLGRDGLDLLVNNAGGQYVAAAANISARGMASVLDLNLTAIANLIAAAQPGLVRAGGTVVTISLSSPGSGIPGIAHSAAARAAIVALTQQLAHEWAPDHIALHCLAPGTVLTDGVREELAPATLERTLADTPLRRDTTVAEVAEWVAALAADVARLGPGVVLELDGGAGIHGVGALTANAGAAGAPGLVGGETVTVRFGTGGGLHQAAHGELATGLAEAFLSAQAAALTLEPGAGLLFVVHGEAAASPAACAAIGSLTHSLALEWAPALRVNAVLCARPSDADGLLALMSGPAGGALTGQVLAVRT